MMSMSKSRERSIDTIVVYHPLFTLTSAPFSIGNVNVKVPNLPQSIYGSPKKVERGMKRYFPNYFVTDIFEPQSRLRYSFEMFKFRGSGKGVPEFHFES